MTMRLGKTPALAGDCDCEMPSVGTLAGSRRPRAASKIRLAERFCVKVGGSTLSCHITKKAADRAAAKKAGAKVVDRTAKAGRKKSSRR